MATKDLRLLDDGDALLTDGPPRRERGVPVSELVAVAGEGCTGTTVRFRPDPALVEVRQPDATALTGFAWLGVPVAGLG